MAGYDGTGLSSLPVCRVLPSQRPDRIQGSRVHNVKELRPPSTSSSEIRMLFAFDLAREAIFLVAGDKAGNWNRWYDRPSRWPTSGIPSTSSISRRMNHEH